MKKSSLTEDKAEQTPTGGVLVGKRQGQTIIHNKGTLSGYLVGKTHAEGGIKAVNKSTGQALEMQGGEVVITAPAVSDNTKREFEGKMMTNREILSTINEKGGGVSFAKGGDVPKNIKRSGASYKYGGKTMTDHEIYKHITGGHLAEGMTLTQIAKKHKVSVKELQKQVDLGMKAESEHTSSKREQMKIVKDHLFENPKYYTLLKRAGLKHGGAVRRGSLVRDAKSGNTPARDLNNYNDMLDVEADGQVGGDTGLFARGGSLIYAKGGATDVVVDNWNDIPDAFKKIRLPKKIDWDEIPSDEGLNEIVKPFLGANKYSNRIATTGINFDDNGITVTDSHILLTIPTLNKNYKGVYKKTKTGVEIINEPYPLYPRVIPNEKEITNVFYIDIVKLLTYCKVAKNYSGEREIVFKINNDFMAFFPDLMINFLSSLIKLTGNTEWNVSFNKTNIQALIFTKYPSYELGRDIIGLIMPFAGQVYQYGTRNPDNNADLNVFFDFDNNEIVNTDGSTVDLDVKPTRQRAKKTTASKTSVPITPDADSVIAIMIYNEDKVFIDGADTVYKLLDILIQAQKDGIYKFFRKYVFEDSDIYQANYISWIENNPSVNGDINPYATSPTELKEWLRKQTDLNSKPFNLDYFFSKSASATLTPTATATTSGLYKDSEIKLFQVIDEIIERNNFDPLENPIVDFTSTGRYKNFNLVDDETGEVFNLRSYNETLGVREEDTSKDRAKGLLKIYINWKATQPSASATPTATATTSGKFSIAEIEMFKEIDSIVKNNGLKSVDTLDWKEGIKTNDFLVGNSSTGEVFKLRSYVTSLGVRFEDIDIDKSKSMIEDYNDWKATQTIGGTSATTIAPPIGSNKPIDVSRLTRNDLSNVKIWLGSNPELSEKIQKRAFELGLKWVDGDLRVTELDAPCLIFNGSGNTDNRIEKRASKSLFDNVNLEEIFVTDFTTTAMPTSLPIDLKQKKIFIGDNPALSEKVQKKAFELGWFWETSSNSVRRTNDKALFFFNDKSMLSGDETTFSSTSLDEITEADLFGTANATATPTSVPFDLTKTKIWIGNNPALSEKIQKRAMELGWDWWSGDGTPKFLDYTNLFFDINNKITSASDETNFDSFKDFREIDEADLFGTFTTPTSAPIDLTETKIWIGQDEALSEKIQKRAFELGWFWDNRTPNKPSHTEGTYLNFWANKTIGWSDVDKLGFNQMAFKEIFESDLFPTSTPSKTSKQNAPVEDEDWVKKFTADLDKLVTYLPNDMDFAPELSKERKDLNALIQLLPSFQQSKYAIERAKILKEIKKLHNKLTYEGFIKPNEALSSDADLFTPQGLLDYYFTQATQNPTAELEPACELITPNGEKSKLPMSAYLNVRTEQFKNWFGDWEKAYETGNYVNCSKMIDPDTKEPKIYFHGVRKYVPNFGQFSNMGQGVVRPYGAFEPPSFPASYFAGDEDYAKFYGGVAENLPTPSADYKPFIYKVFLSVKNPISLLPLDFMLSYKDFMDYIYVGYGVKVEPNQELLKVLNNDLTKKNPMWIYVRRDIGFIEKLKDYGYDAIFQMGDIPTFLPNGEVEPDRTKHLQEVEYLTFYPNQVKSATVKKSFYFDFFNDIRFKNGGYVRI